MRVVIIKIYEINLIDLGIMVMMAEVFVMMMNMVLIILSIIFILKSLPAFVSRFRDSDIILILLFISVSFL